MAVHLSKAARAAAEGGSQHIPSYQEVQQFHTQADVNASTAALHHTLGSQPAQASPGDHVHDGGSSNPLFDSGSDTISGTRGTAGYYTSLENLLTKLGASNTATGP